MPDKPEARESEKQLVSIGVSVENLGQLPKPEAANFFYFAQIGGMDIQLMVGYIDPANVHMLTSSADATKNKKEIVVTPEITHRFALNARALLHLQSQVNEIVQSIRDSGALDQVSVARKG